MSDDCIFCRIVNGDIPSATIYEDEEFKAFFDGYPSSLGHTLVVPKNHVADIFQIDAAQGARLFALVISLAKKLKTALGCDSVNILQNNGRAAGQTVFHFHVHIIPRYEGDDVNIHWKTVKPAPEETERLRRLLAE